MRAAGGIECRERCELVGDSVGFVVGRGSVPYELDNEDSDEANGVAAGALKPVGAVEGGEVAGGWVMCCCCWL